MYTRHMEKYNSCWQRKAQSTTTATNVTVATLRNRERSMLIKWRRSARNVRRYECFEWGRRTFRNVSSDCRHGNNSRNMAHKLRCAAQYYSVSHTFSLSLFFSVGVNTNKSQVPVYIRAICCGFVVSRFTLLITNASQSWMSSGIVYAKY